MPTGFLALVLATATQTGMPGASEPVGWEGQFEPRYPVDAQQNWVHGYFQEIPAYGGHAPFRPYNYKQVLSQSQISAGWGHSPVMPYSQQFWSRYHDQATMLKLSRSEVNRAIMPAAASSVDEKSRQSPPVIQPSSAGSIVR